MLRYRKNFLIVKVGTFCQKQKGMVRADNFIQKTKHTERTVRFLKLVYTTSFESDSPIRWFLHQSTKNGNSRTTSTDTTLCARGAFLLPMLCVCVCLIWASEHPYHCCCKQYGRQLYLGNARQRCFLQHHLLIGNIWALPMCAPTVFLKITLLFLN